MIRGIGVDMVEISRVESILQRFGERFARRILSPAELIEFAQSTQPGRFLAKRFAAKEAAAKAFGTGFRNGLWFSHIAITHDSNGRPALHYEGPAATLAEQQGIDNSLISVSDEANLAIAFVTLESR